MLTYEVLVRQTCMIDRIASSGKKLVTVRYEVLADRLVRPNTRKSQNKYFVHILLQSAYSTLILIGINEFCANMIK